MNWEHFRAFVWLRWRLDRNQWRRGGALNAALMAIVAIGLLVLAIPLFFISLLVGLIVFPKAPSEALLLGWDAMVLGFVFFWSIGVIAELQRTESLTLSKFMHLPVSIKEAFLINYLSSLVRLSLLVFVPVMFGCGLALVFTKGVATLTVLPLTVAFLLMVSAITYQFQGWLAVLMSNPRRRRTVVVLTTAVFVLIFQLPQLVRLAGPWRAWPDHRKHMEQSNKLADEVVALDRALKSGKLDTAGHKKRMQEILRENARVRAQSEHETTESLRQTAWLANLVLPIGWLPLGVMYAAQGAIWPALAGTLAMTLVGVACLWRSYQTTVGLYLGRGTARKIAPVRAADVVADDPARALRRRWMETRIPGVSEAVAGVALASLRSLIRAPESKMMLLTPIMLAAIFGSMILRSDATASDFLRVLLATGALGVALFGAMQIMANQFGFDRDGFRVFVLCAAPRRDILLGKNLAFLPLAVTMAGLLLVALQIVRPLRWDHFLAMAPQFVSMFLTFCALMNLVSILAPMHIAAGSLKPATPKLVPILVQMLMVSVFFPVTQVPMLLPLAVEALLAWRGWTGGLPVLLLLALVQCAVVIFVYRWLLRWQGELLRSREQMILEIVTSR